MCERVSKSLVAPGSDVVNNHVYQLCNNASSFIDIVAVRNTASCNDFVVASTVGPSGSGGVMAPFSKWVSGEPNNGNATDFCSRGDLREACVSFSANASDGQWIDRDCTLTAEQLSLAASEWAVHQCVVCAAAVAIASPNSSNVDESSIATNGTAVVHTTPRPTHPSESPSVLSVIGAVVGAVIVVFLIFCCILAANRRKKHDKQADQLAEMEARELNERMEDYYKCKHDKHEQSKRKSERKKGEKSANSGTMSGGRTHEFEDAADES